MGKVQHTVTGCVPVDRSALEAYLALITTNKNVNDAEQARVEAEESRVLAENARVNAEASRVDVESSRVNAEAARALAENARVEAETARETQAGADHTRAEGDHEVAVGDHTQASEDHAASSAATDRANEAAAAAEHMVDIHRGPKGDQGNTGSSVDYPYELINNLTTNDPTKGLSAAQGVALDGEITRLRQSVERRTDVLGPSMTSPWVYGKFIAASDLSIATSALWCYSAPISVKRGDVVSVYTAGTGVSVVTKSSAMGELISSLVGSESSASATVPVRYSYTMLEDAYIIICYKYTIPGTYYEINGIRQAISDLQNTIDGKLIRLVGIAANATDGNITGVGQVYYNTVSKELRKCINYHPPLTSDDFVVIPFYDGAIYTYGAGTYVWSGTDLLNIFSKNAYKEGVPSWQANHQYSVGDKVIYDNIVWKCSIDHTSSTSFNYARFAVADNAGVDISSNEIVSGGCKILKIVGFGTMAAGNSGVTKVGDVFFNTSNEKLWICTSFTSSTDFTTVAIPFFDGAIYTYNNELYHWDGTAIIKIYDIVGDYPQGTGDVLFKINEQSVARLAAADKLVKIKAFATSAANAGITAAGEAYYNTDTKVINKCIVWGGSVDMSTWVAVPYYTGAIYLYNNGLYIWNGTDLINILNSAYKSLRDGKIPIYAEEHKGIINTSGEIVEPTYSPGLLAYRYTGPIKVNKGERIVVKSSTGGYAAISETDASGSFYTCLVESQTGGVDVEYSYIVPEDMYIACSYREEGHELYSSISADVDVDEIETLMYEKGVVINSITEIQSSEESGGANIIRFTLANGTTYDVTIYNGQQGEQGDSLILGDGDSYILYNTLGSNTDGAISQKVVTEKLAEISHQNDFFGGIYVYDFRTLPGKDIWIYKDALFTGLKPIDNYEVFVPNSDSPYIKNYSRRALKFNASSAGTYTLHMRVRDIYNKVKFSKDVSVVVRNAPTQKLENDDHLNVFFFGDSIIGQNNNAIGAEFYRYLSSDDAGGTNSDGSIKPPATNICDSKLRLVGEMVQSGTRFQYLFQVASALTLKRDIPYGDSAGNDKMYWMSHNPFYNPNSTEPDEIGEDGFNKRVDFQWYFENACGEGEFPGLIYMSIGANDIGTFDNYWSGESIDVTAERLIAVCKKMKAACDAIAGGDSGVKIKLFNHQSYPLYFASYNNLPIEQARCVQNRYYNAVIAEIASESVGSYVELVDCASKFDIENGYNVGAINTNSRSTAVNDSGLLSGDGVHMNTVGAYQYADSLIDDFIADADFD